MPIEINELVIKTSIEQNAGSPGGGSSSTSAGGNAAPGEEMIKLCVEKVLEIVKEKNER